MKRVFQQSKEFILKWGKEGYKFLRSRIFLVNFAMALGIIFLAFALTFFGLRMYTRHGQSITLQDFSGMKIDQVKKEIKKNRLKFVIIDSLYVAEKEPGIVLDQDPAPDAKVKQKRTVYLTINSSTPPSVKLPNIWNIDLKFARKMLKARGLDVDDSKIIYRKDKAENTVLEVMFEGETLLKPRGSTKETDYRVPKGSKLGLVIAERGGGVVPIPKLTCYTYDEAVFKIKSSNLSLGVVITDNTVTDTASSFVYRQNPETGEFESLRMGEQVDIWITQLKPAACNDTDLFGEFDEGEGQ